MSRRLRTIEINGTYYRTQTPDTFAKWADETPDGFVFTVKAPRYATNKKVLAEAGPSIEVFVQSGLARLGSKLGPILWQFMPTKRFDPADFGAFLDLLPREAAGLRLRHALEVRHPSFADPVFVELARKAGAAIVFADHAEYPGIADLTADFVYARLQRGGDEVATCYPEPDLVRWAETARAWSRGDRPPGLAYVEPADPPSSPRDVFLFLIHEGKSRAPHGAEALQALLNAPSA